MPIRSMTGYGQALHEQNSFRVSVEIRSVNHRFAEFQVRLAKEYAGLDDVIRDTLSSYVARGRCDVYIGIESASALSKRVSVDWGLLSELVRIEHEAHARGFELAPVNWLTEMDVLSVETVSTRLDEVQDPIVEAVKKACEALIAMRTREGERLDADLRGKLSILEKTVTELTVQADGAEARVRAKLLERLKELELSVSPERLLAEVTLLLERSAVDEELVRLKSHIEEFYRSLEGGSPVGRRLDFIVQEMHREVNTVASKAADFNVSRPIVDAKTVIEQLREQVQNIE
ncbi:YicC/YloC family endoribonuclease [Alicyclobacillus mengziensis]|uniref:YicC family protein n=1 Tax=Alicyclobacillus mengziensis TaxID=2931921 RepID=A0A9X7W2E7_9BACL|nr:YicC/YloC family endoribonuclease [Alicyclobacillus mengziensis]QSO49498.1 YicC family protein [Alicyclobacillus mengziensis]